MTIINVAAYETRRAVIGEWVKTNLTNVEFVFTDQVLRTKGFSGSTSSIVLCIATCTNGLVLVGRSHSEPIVSVLDVLVNQLNNEAWDDLVVQFQSAFNYSVRPNEFEAHSLNATFGSSASAPLGLSAPSGANASTGTTTPLQPVVAGKEEPTFSSMDYGMYDPGPEVDLEPLDPRSPEISPNTRVPIPPSLSFEEELIPSNQTASLCTEMHDRANEDEVTQMLESLTKDLPGLLDALKPERKNVDSDPLPPEFQKALNGFIRKMDDESKEAVDDCNIASFAPDYGVSGNYIDKAVQALDEAIPNGQIRRGSVALILLKEGVRLLENWMLLKGYTNDIHHLAAMMWGNRMVPLKKAKVSIAGYDVNSLTITTEWWMKPAFFSDNEKIDTVYSNFWLKPNVAPFSGD